MSSFTESADDTLPRAPSTVWTLTLVHHSDEERLGRRVELGTAALRLGRDSEVFGADTWNTKSISREHAEISSTSDGSLILQDLGSKNGSFVNGARVERALLHRGDVVGLGGRLLVVGTALEGRLSSSEVGEEPTHAPQGSSIAIAAARATARAVAKGHGPVIVVGECGSGKNVFADYIHALSGRSPLVVLHPGAFSDGAAPDVLFGGNGSGLLEKARGGTLLIDDLELAGPKLQTALLRFLDYGEVPTGGGSTDIIDVRTIVATNTPLEALVDRGILSPALAGRLGMSVVEVPPLRLRPEDVPLLFREALTEAGVARHVRIDARLVLALLRCPWPDNVRELRAFARHVAESERVHDDRIELTPEHLHLLRSDPALAAVSFATATDDLVVARDGSWFARGGERVDLSRRPNLARVLALLASRHESEGEEAAVSVAALFREGWPDERVARGSAAARVYVAIGTLRKLGLREYVESADGGYRLAPKSRLRIVATAPRASRASV